MKYVGDRKPGSWTKKSYENEGGRGWRWVDNLNGTKLQFILNGYFKYIAVTGFWCRKYKINQWES